MKKIRFVTAILCAFVCCNVSSAQNQDKERLKANLERAFSPAPQTPEQPEQAVAETADGIRYYVQVLSSVRTLDSGDKAFRIFPDLKFVREGGYFKYYTGTGTSYSDAKTLVKTVRSKGYPDAFIIVLKYGIKIPLKDALNEQGLKE